MPLLSVFFTACSRSFQNKSNLKEHPSIPFNPDIATAFFRAGLIEAWRRGTLKILRERQKSGLPAPLFSYAPSGFRVEFQKSSVKSSVKIMEQMRENRFVTIPELAKMQNVSTRTIEKQIVNLKENRQIECVGADKGGYWEVLEP